MKPADTAECLRKLQGMLEAGLITQDEFDAQRANIITSI